MRSSPRSEEFFEVERDRLFRTLCVVTGSRQEAEDVAQDAFVEVLERWEQVGGMDKPAGYLYRTALNRPGTGIGGCCSRSVGSCAPRRPRTSTRRSRIAMRSTALAPLTPRQRAAIVLTEGLGYSREEAGQMLGVKGSTVRALLFQARASLERQGKPADV